MAIVRVQHAGSGNHTVSVSSRVATLGSTPTSGNLLVIMMSLGSGGSPTATLSESGFTNLEWLTPGTGEQLALWYKIAGGSEATTATITVDVACNLAVWIGEYSGVDTSSPVVASTLATGSNTTLSSGKPITPTTCDNLQIGALGHREGAAGTAWTNPTSGPFHSQVNLSNPSGRNGSGDTVRVMLRTWELITNNFDDNAYEITLGFSSSAATGPGVIGIFKPSGATSGDTLASGTGAAAEVDAVAVTQAAASTSFSPAWSGGSATAGNLLIVYIQGIVVGDIVTMPTNWNQHFLAGSNRRLFYKIADGNASDSGSFSWTIAVTRSGLQVELSGFSNTGFISSNFHSHWAPHQAAGTNFQEMGVLRDKLSADSTGDILGLTFVETATSTLTSWTSNSGWTKVTVEGGSSTTRQTGFFRHFTVNGDVYHDFESSTASVTNFTIVHFVLGTATVGGGGATGNVWAWVQGG